MNLSENRLSEKSRSSLLRAFFLVYDPDVGIWFWFPYDLSFVSSHAPVHDRPIIIYGSVIDDFELFLSSSPFQTRMHIRCFSRASPRPKEVEFEIGRDLKSFIGLLIGSGINGDLPAFLRSSFFLSYLDRRFR